MVPDTSKNLGSSNSLSLTLILATKLEKETGKHPTSNIAPPPSLGSKNLVCGSIFRCEKPNVE